MKKITLVLIVLFSMVLVSCGGAKKVDTPNVSAGSDIWVKSSNKQLARIPVEGFGYKKSEVPAQKWDQWAKLSAPVVKRILDNLPAGYVLQVTGHTDARGPEEPEGAKPGNIKLSNDRAKEVHASLRRQGISSQKMIYKGVGSSEPREGISPRSAKQRRVSFIVVPE